MENLFKLIQSQGYTLIDNMWKKGNSKKDDYALANVIVSSSEYDNSSTGIATLMLDITTSKHLYIEWLRTFKEEKTKKSQSFIEAYIDYITQNEQVGDVDRAIWGNLYQAVREDANIYYVIPTGVASEYKEVSDDLDNIQKSFIDGEVYSTKYGKVKRGFLFQKVINSLIKAYPLDNFNFATPEDLENKALSPIILKHLISTTAIKDKGDILGYKLETDIKAKIQDYFRVSSGVVGGNIPNLGTLETLTNSTKVPCLRYFNLEEFPKQGSYPNWDNFMSQFRNASAREVFMSWVYSIFKATNKGSQLMWLHDGGGSGKSSVIKALHHFLDNSLGSLNDNNMTSDFGLETVVGKRLVVNADCKKPSIIHSQLVHCLTPDHEVLTPTGWVYISESENIKKVAQYDLSTREISYTSDLVHYVRDIDEEIYHFESKKFSQKVTKYHRMVYRDTDASSQYQGNNDIRLAKDMNYSIGRSCVVSGEITSNTGQSILTPLERFFIALQADSSTSCTAGVKGYTSYNFNLAKPRKIKRLCRILEELKTMSIINSWSKTKRAYTTTAGLDTYGISIQLKNEFIPLNFNHKNLSSWVVFDNSLEWNLDFLEEISKWDGHRVSREDKFGRIMYGSIIKSNVEVVKTIAHLSGKYGAMTKKHRKQCTTQSDMYELTISDSDVKAGTSSTITTGATVHKEKMQYKGSIHCLSVPTTAFLVRHNGKISITGNCLTTSDPVSVNKKHKSMYTSKLYSKVLICSNSAPNLHTSEYNQVRRMIYLRLNSLTLEDKVKQGRIKMVDGVAVDISNAEQFVGNLIKEFPAFMYDAKTCYEKLCSSDNIIFLDNNLMNDIETLNDSIMDSLQAHITKEYIVIKTTEAISKNKILVDFDELIFELELEFKGTQGLRFKVKELLNSVFKLDTVNHKTDIKGKKVRHIAGFDGQVRGGLCLLKKI